VGFSGVGFIDGCTQKKPTGFLGYVPGCLNPETCRKRRDRDTSQLSDERSVVCDRLTVTVTSNCYRPSPERRLCMWKWSALRQAGTSTITHLHGGFITAFSAPKPWLHPTRGFCRVDTRRHTWTQC